MWQASPSHHEPPQERNGQRLLYRSALVFIFAGLLFASRSMHHGQSRVGSVSAVMSTRRDGHTDGSYSKYATVQRLSEWGVRFGTAPRAGGRRARKPTRPGTCGVVATGTACTDTAWCVALVYNQRNAVNVMRQPLSLTPHAPRCRSYTLLRVLTVLVFQLSAVLGVGPFSDSRSRAGHTRTRAALGRWRSAHHAHQSLLRLRLRFTSTRQLSPTSRHTRPRARRFAVGTMRWSAADGTRRGQSTWTCGPACAASPALTTVCEAGHLDARLRKLFFQFFSFHSRPLALLTFKTARSFRLFQLFHI